MRLIIASPLEAPHHFLCHFKKLNKMLFPLRLLDSPHHILIFSFCIQWASFLPEVRWKVCFILCLKGGIRKSFIDKSPQRTFWIFTNITNPWKIEGHSEVTVRKQGKEGLFKRRAPSECGRCSLSKGGKGVWLKKKKVPVWYELLVWEWPLKQEEAVCYKTCWFSEQSPGWPSIQQECGLMEVCPGYFKNII